MGWGGDRVVPVPGSSRPSGGGSWCPPAGAGPAGGCEAGRAGGERPGRCGGGVPPSQNSQDRCCEREVHSLKGSVLVLLGWGSVVLRRVCIYRFGGLSLRKKVEYS